MKWVFNCNLELLLIPVLLGLAVVKCSKNETTKGIETDLGNGTIAPNILTNGNDTSGVVGSERNSRQLWSFVKKVIKSSLDQQNNGNSNGNPVSGAMGGALSSLFSSGIASAISSASNLNQNQNHQQLNHLQQTNPNEYMHYLLLNSQAQQHTSLPHYQQQQHNQQMDGSTSDLIQKYQEQMTSSTNNNGETVSSTGNQILSKLALGSILDDFDLDNVANFLSFGTFERMVDKVNKFDKLKCIPRLLCQMVAKRHEDAAKSEATSTTTSRPGKAKKRRSDDVDLKKEEKNKKESDEQDDSPEDDDDDDEDDESEEERVVIKPGGSSRNGRFLAVDGADTDTGGSSRSGRFLKVDGADTALEQFVKFLELMQLKDWSLYPYLQGAYQGSKVGRTEDCATRFASCPFSDEQLVYYFNNYNGGFFQSI